MKSYFTGIFKNSGNFSRHFSNLRLKLYILPSYRMKRKLFQKYRFPVFQKNTWYSIQLHQKISRKSAKIYILTPNLAASNHTVNFVFLVGVWDGVGGVGGLLRRCEWVERPTGWIHQWLRPTHPRRATTRPTNRRSNWHDQPRNGLNKFLFYPYAGG